MAKISEIVRPKKSLRVLADDSDHRILEAALEGKANFIVSGDKHLLSLKEFKGIKIIKAKDLVSRNF